MTTNDQEAIKLHKKLRGKIEIKPKLKIKNLDQLSKAYTPGVAAVCLAIKKDKRKSWELTNRANQVAIVSDGTAILGLGNIGPEAGMPVMEGKSLIFKEFANIDAIPLCINTTDVEEIIKFCKYIEPSFAGINLEDISAPRCFEILDRLEKELNIAIFHDDQDGTAIVVLAALINACRVTGKVFKDLKIVINGAGAAGIAVARLLASEKPDDLILLDRIGAIYKGRAEMNYYKNQIAEFTNKNKIKGRLEETLKDADVFIGLSQGNLLNEKLIKLMSPDPIIFAMANPVPEIVPEKAYRAGASLVGTGSSSYPNQINNALVFPGIFRGLLDSGKKIVTKEVKIATALAIAYSIKPTKDKILPSILDKNVVKKIAKAVEKRK
jgi:malate dehydrogenase (oxaloacetate-decarboxylating)